MNVDTGERETTSQDLDPDKDQGNDLFIYSTDAPDLAMFALDMAVKSVFRERLNFVDQALYADVPCSGTLDWHMHQSITRKGFSPTGGNNFPLDDFQRDTTFDKVGDNSVGPGHLPLTIDLAKGKAPLPPFQVLDVSSVDATAQWDPKQAFSRTDDLRADYRIFGKDYPVQKKPTLVFQEITGKGPKVDVNGQMVEENFLTGRADFADRDTPGIYVPVVTLGNQCVRPLGRHLVVIGPIKQWAFPGFGVDPNDAKALLGLVWGVDALGFPVAPLPKAPKVARGDTSTLEFTIGDLTGMPEEGGYSFPVKVTKKPAKGPFTFEFKADGSGVTGSGKFTLEVLP